MAQGVLYSPSFLGRLRARLGQRGFTLIELAVVLAVLAVLAGATVPYAAIQVRNQAAEKTGREMLAIADAAKSYHVANAAWPASIEALQTAGFLAGAWNATNPFGNPYVLTSGTTLTVTSTVPSDVASAVTRLVPLGTQTVVAGGTSVAGTWPRPGQSSDLASVQGLPQNAIVFYDGLDCAAAGLTEVASARGRVIVGRPSGGTLNGTVGTALGDLENRTHTHTYSDVIAHTHSLNDPGHTHAFAGYPGNSWRITTSGTGAVTGSKTALFNPRRQASRSTRREFRSELPSRPAPRCRTSSSRHARNLELRGGDAYMSRLRRRFINPDHAAQTSGRSGPAQAEACRDGRRSGAPPAAATSSVGVSSTAWFVQ